MAHGANELQLSLEHVVRLDGLGEELTLLDENLKQVLRDARLQTRRQVEKESVQLLLKVETVV